MWALIAYCGRVSRSHCWSIIIFWSNAKHGPIFWLISAIPQIKEYIQEEEEKKSTNAPKVVKKKKDINEYESVSDFVYKKMTFAGMVDRNLVLSEKDLRIMKRLVNDELAELKKKK